MKKLTKNQRLALIASLAVIGFFVGIFIYNNLIVPWPHRHELKACLQAAQAQATDAEIEAARHQCFRTYPHFN